MLFTARFKFICIQQRFGGRRWQKTKYDKAANDLGKSRIFNGITNKIVAAIREKNGETDTFLNQHLASALHSAKAAQMPKTKIEDAIKRATNMNKETSGKIIIYQGLGPAGVAILVEALVTNPNKTAQQVRTIFKKNGGSMGPVEYLFQRKGYILVGPGKTGDNLEKTIIEGDLTDIDDVNTVDDDLEIFCSPSNVYKLQSDLSAKVKSY